MIAACSPADRNFEETLNTLQYANRAKNIQNTSKKNVTNPQHIVKELRMQLEELQAKLLEGAGNTISPSPGLEGADDAMNAEIHALRDEQAQLTQKMDRDRFVGLAKNGILQFKIHYYRKQKTQADAELGGLRSEVEAIRAMVVERSARAVRLETEAELLRERRAEADRVEKITKARLRGILHSFIPMCYYYFLLFLVDLTRHAHEDNAREMANLCRPKPEVRQIPEEAAGRASLLERPGCESTDARITHGTTRRSRAPALRGGCVTQDAQRRTCCATSCKGRRTRRIGSRN